MKLNTNSNAYIIIYSAVMVVIVAFLLAFVYQALKPMQDRNVELDIQKQILYSLNIRNLDGEEAQKKFYEVIKGTFPYEGRTYYKCKVDGKDIVVVELKGMGLWGGIGGFIAIERPANTVYGGLTVLARRKKQPIRSSWVPVAASRYPINSSMRATSRLPFR